MPYEDERIWCLEDYDGQMIPRDEGRLHFLTFVYHWTTETQILTQNQTFLSHLNPRLSECNAHIHYSEENYPTSGYLVRFTLYGILTRLTSHKLQLHIINFVYQLIVYTTKY